MTQQVFNVSLPGGGELQVQSVEEMDLWERSRERYIEDYHLTKQNDLVLLGAILQQQLLVFRAQRLLNGMEPELDANNIPTGAYRLIPPDGEQMAGAMKMLKEASDQIRMIEKALGIDKVTREAGGQHTTANYLQTLKRAAHERGVHISKRTLAYENFVNDLRTRVRVLLNADAEDRHHHNLTPENLFQWVQEKVDELAQIDIDYAREKGKVFVGKL